MEFIPWKDLPNGIVVAMAAVWFGLQFYKAWMQYRSEKKAAALTSGDKIDFVCPMGQGKQCQGLAAINRILDGVEVQVKETAIQTDEMSKLHAPKGEDGLPVWYARSKVTEHDVAMKTAAASLTHEHETIISSVNVLQQDIRRLVDRIDAWHNGVHK